MAEYYPLLAKAIGSLPNSTPELRRVVYERARKALIGQLRTLHPPVPDDDIERESVELDRAVERLESELANGAAAAPPAGSVEASIVAPAPAKPAPPKPAPARPAPPQTQASTSEGGAIGPAAKRPLPPLRPRPPKPPDTKSVTPGAAPARPASLKPPVAPPSGSKPVVPPPPVVESGAEVQPVQDFEPLPAPTGSPAVVSPDVAAPAPAGQPFPGATAPPPASDDGSRRLKPPQRPIAPQPARAAGPKRRLWIIPAVLAVVVALVAVAAWKLRDRPETIARNKPADQTQAESGKIAERVGAPATTPSTPTTNGQTPSEEPASSTQPSPANPTPKAGPSNPELPVAHRAALLVEAPDEPNKVKTFVGNVVWKLNNAPQGATDAVGLAVEADIDLPDDKTKVIVTFEKNSDASLPASHTIKVRFMVEPGSFSGSVKQISVPQMRPEASPNGEALAGVTVQIVPNSFLVGLSPGNAEAANTDLIRRLQWVDIPMLLDNGKIAKLTFEKSDSGQRDLNEAFQAWQK